MNLLSNAVKFTEVGEVVVTVAAQTSEDQRYVLHVAVNRGVAPAIFVGSRNEATAQESMVLRPEMNARVP